MNYPEIAGEGDTLGIVWQDNRSGMNKIYFSHSTSGLPGLSAPVHVSDFVSGIQVNPHLVYSQGVFHITWRDLANNLVWYRKMSFSNDVLSVTEDASIGIVYPNPASDLIVLPSADAGKAVWISDSQGKSVYYGKPDSDKKINTGDLTPGVYHIHFFSKGKPVSSSLIIQ